jgi:hypothetical protein
LILQIIKVTIVVLIDAVSSDISSINASSYIQTSIEASEPYQPYLNVRFANTVSDIMVSRKRQFSEIMLSCVDTALIQLMSYICATVVLKSNGCAVKLAPTKAPWTFSQHGISPEHILPSLPLLSCGRPSYSGGTGAAKRNWPIGGWAKRMFEKV